MKAIVRPSEIKRGNNLLEISVNRKDMAPILRKKRKKLFPQSYTMKFEKFEIWKKKFENRLAFLDFEQRIPIIHDYNSPSSGLGSA